MTNYFQQIHDKATRNEPLTAEEETELAARYAHLDQEEAALLNSSSHTSFTTETLRAEIEKALTHLQTTAEQVREQIHENEVLRRDIGALTQKLA